EEIENLLSGRPDRLQEIPLDLDGVPAFHRRVYEAVRAIPAGCTTTYGELAARIGAPGAARAVGQAMAQNPFTLIVPCHRVLSSAGRLGGFSAHGGVVTKMRLLLRERDATCAGRLEFDPDAAVEHLRRDPAMARLIETAGPLRPRLRPAESVFDALAHSIVHQQLSGRAASAIHARLAALFPNAHLGLHPRRLLRAHGDPPGGRPFPTEDRCASRARRELPARRDPFLRRTSGDDRRSHRRAAHRASGRGPLDGGDAPHLPPGPPRRLAGRRSRRASGLR